MKLTRNHPLFETFLNLSCALSPENLSCDGELPRAEVARRYRQLNHEWKAAEREFGAKVTESDVFAAYDA